MKTNIKLFIAAIVMMMPTMAHSQAVSFLTLSPDAKSQAMGGASVASEADAFAILNNPASIALSDDTFAAALSYNMWQSAGVQSDLTTFSTYFKSGEKFGMGLSYRSFAKPSYEMYDDSGNYIEDFQPSDTALDFALSYAISDNMSIGATIKFISSELSSSYSGSAVGADIGVTYLLDCATLAASFSNIGSIDYESLNYSLPNTFKLGGSYNVTNTGLHSCVANMELDYLCSESALGVRVGAQYGFKDMVFARLGYHHSLDDLVASSYLSAGLGVELYGVSLNWSYLLGNQDSSPVAGSMNISLGCRF